MTRPFRILGDLNSSSSATASSQPTDVHSDYVVILAALLCALICVLGLVAVVRCAWLRRIYGGTSSRTGTETSAVPRTTAAANKGLKKKILRTLPKLVLTSESACKFSDCAICLSEFAIGDEIRVLPQCGHGFHVSCIDTWLGSHSSCPSCRQVFVMARCDKCGGFPAGTRTASAAASSSSTRSQSETAFKQREDHANRFLP